MDNEVTLKKLVKITINEAVSTPSPKNNWLYHVTSAKNLESIKRVGLIPEWGDVVRTSYGDSYDFDNKKTEWGNDYDEESELVRLDIDGILFFADTPHVMYSHFTDMKKFNWNNVVIAVVQKNEYIYRKIGDDDFVNYKGQATSEIRYGYNSAYTRELPIIIETGDWFSLEEQKPKLILHGIQAQHFVTTYFPSELTKHNL